MEADQQLPYNLQFRRRCRLNGTISHEELSDDRDAERDVTTRRGCRCEERRKTELPTAVGLGLIIIAITITVIQPHMASLSESVSFL